MLKKLVVVSILLVFIIVGFSWLLPPPEVEASSKTTGLPIKVARYYWRGEFWIEIADRKGWFEEGGLNVELVDSNPDYSVGIDAIVARPVIATIRALRYSSLQGAL